MSAASAFVEYREYCQNGGLVKQADGFDWGALGQAALDHPAITGAIGGAGIGALTGIGSGHMLRNALIGGGIGGSFGYGAGALMVGRQGNLGAGQAAPLKDYDFNTSPEAAELSKNYDKEHGIGASISSPLGSPEWDAANKSYDVEHPSVKPPAPPSPAPPGAVSILTAAAGNKIKDEANDLATMWGGLQNAEDSVVRTGKKVIGGAGKGFLDQLSQYNQSHAAK